jgi:hypothetical protein
MCHVIIGRYVQPHVLGSSNILSHLGNKYVDVRTVITFWKNHELWQV